MGPFRQGLDDLGDVEGRNFVIETRFAERKLERSRGGAMRLKGIVAALLFALTAPLAVEAQRTFSGSCQAIFS
jgi:hypothetical protein